RRRGSPRPRRAAAPVRLPGLSRRRAVRVLVTGATGFTGGHLAATLARRGDTVRALVRDAKKAAELTRAGVALQIGDLGDREALASAAAGVEVIYHVAAIYRQAGLPREAYHAVNASAAAAVVEAAAGAGATRVVHCSTVGVHGDIERPPADENAPLRP